MISEKQALEIVEEELSATDLKQLQHKQLYAFMQSYVNTISSLGEQGELKEFGTQLLVGNRLYMEGADEVKEVINNVYLYALAQVMDRLPELDSVVRKNVCGAMKDIVHRHRLSAKP